VNSKNILRRPAVGFQFGKSNLALVVATGAVFIPIAAYGQIFVANSLNGTISEYSTSGTTISAALVSGLSNPSDIAVSGSDLFVTNYSAGTIGEYTTSGGTVSTDLVSGLNGPIGVAVSGSDLFVANYGSGTIGEYTTSGGQVTTSLVTGLSDVTDLVASGSDLFVLNNNAVSEYTTSGSQVSASLASGFAHASGVAVSGSDIYVTDMYMSTVGEFTTAGTTVDTSFITGIYQPFGITVSGSDIYVVSNGGDSIGEYTTTGTVVTAPLVTGLTAPAGIAVVASDPDVVWDNAGSSPAGNGEVWDTTSGNWSDGGGSTYSNGSNVVFNDTNNGNYSVTLNTTVSPGSVTVNNSSGNYTISGTGKIIDAGAFVKSGSDTLTLGTALSVGSMSITGGTLQLAAGVSAGTGPAATSAINLTSLTISGNGTLDIYNNHVIITYSSSDPISTIYGYLKTGFNNGSWNGPGIISSLARTPSNGHGYGVGWADGTDKIVAGLSSGQIEVAYTLLGDANLDGVVNGSDFSILAANFGQGVTNWDQGNFLFTPAVNGTDFAALAANFGQGDGGAAVVSQADIAALDAFAAANGLLADVPEPATAAIVLVTGLGLFRRIRRSQD
jgi:hypothetical protein